MLKPNQVFTPGRPPVHQTNVYVARGEAQETLAKSVDRSMIPLIFGEYGVGKTSLARHVVSAAESAGRLVNVESVDGKSFSQVVQQLLEHVGYTVQRTTVSGATVGVGTTFTGEVGVNFEFFNAKVSAERSNEKSSSNEAQTELFVTTPTDARVLDVAERRELVLILDELHRASPDFVRNLSSFIKSYHNKPCTRFKVLLVGTSSDASRLVESDPGIDRVVQEIRLSGMTDTEAASVITGGMEKLAIRIDDHLVAKLVKSAVGSPSIVQFLALEVAEAAFARAPRIVQEADCKAAVREYVTKRAARLNSSYLKAIETTGEKRYRKQILHAMALVDDDYVTMRQLVEKVSLQLKEDAAGTALSGPLRALKSAEFGGVLKDVERRQEGERVFNYSTFTDPSMKAFIRMRYVAVSDGLVDEDAA